MATLTPRGAGLRTMRLLAACLALLGLMPMAASGSAPPAGVTWGRALEVDAGGGHKGPWRMNASEYDYVDEPAVAIDARGGVALAWVDQAQKDVLFQIFGPGGERRFERPVNVSRSPGVFSWLPRVVLTGEGTDAVAILWQEIVFSGGSHGGDIFFARSRDGGRSFSEPLNLSRSLNGDGKGRLDPEHWDNGSLDLVAGPGGRLHAAWTDYEGTLWVSRSVDAGETFSKPMRLARGAHARPARGPSLAVDGRDTVYLAWAVGEDPSADIHVARSDDQGRSFGEPHVRVGGTGRADAPRLAVDRAGRVHLVYAELPSGPASSARIHYTHAPPGALRFEAPRAVGDGRFPQLALDGQGGLYVAWEHMAGPGERPRGLGFSYSPDRGGAFSSPSVVPETDGPQRGFNSGLQGLFMKKLAVSPTGAVALAHGTYQPEQWSRVWLLRGQAPREGRPPPAARRPHPRD